MWILPSRGRPHNVARFFDHWKKTESTTEGLLVVDEDDHPEEYAKLDFPHGWRMVVYPRMSMCGKSNRAFHENPGRAWYGFVDDDAVPQTLHWDRLLVEAAGRHGLAHCWNGIGNERLASQFVIGGDFARELGWIFYPGLSRIYGDDIITALADDRGVRKYLGDVRLEQMHFSNKKAPMDESYKKPEAGNDKRIYDDWMAKRMSCKKSVTILCLKAGTAYGPEYVNILFDMVRRNLRAGYPGRFVCLTDDPTGLDEGIETLPLPADLETWWGKLYMFKQGLFPDGERVVFMDLDTLIIGDIGPLLDYRGEFATLKDFYFPQQVGPAIITWKAGGVATSIWEEWDAQGRPRMAGGDLVWINNLDQGHFARRIDKLQDLLPGYFCSFKADCHPYPPNGARVVCFHGQPKPDNCATPWVSQVWKVGGAGMAELDAVCNVETTKVEANIIDNCKRDLPWLDILKEHQGQAVIVGGGPSLQRTIVEIHWRKSLGQTIIAVNGSAKFLNAHGIKPDVHVVIDARPENADFLRAPSDQQFIASQCDGETFDAASNPTLFHMNIDRIKSLIPDDRVAHLISSGTTVGLAAMAIAYTQGYRAIHLHGFDSSLSDRHHAYIQPQNDNDAVVEAMVEGRTFKSTPWMIKQVQQFQELALQLADAGVVITVAGDGLLPFVAKKMGESCH